MKRIVPVALFASYISVAVALPPASTTPQAPPSLATYGQSQHLLGWVKLHANLSQNDMLRALGQEPGFNSLSPQIQQKDQAEAVRDYKIIHSSQPPAPSLLPVK
jgi:hypothetical protein